MFLLRRAGDLDKLSSYLVFTEFFFSLNLCLPTPPPPHSPVHLTDVYLLFFSPIAHVKEAVPSSRFFILFFSEENVVGKRIVSRPSLRRSVVVFPRSRWGFYLVFFKIFTEFFSGLVLPPISHSDGRLCEPTGTCFCLFVCFFFLFLLLSWTEQKEERRRRRAGDLQVFAVLP